jgi:hypothetical protein
VFYNSNNDQADQSPVEEPLKRIADSELAFIIARAFVLPTCMSSMVSRKTVAGTRTCNIYVAGALFTSQSFPAADLRSNVRCFVKWSELGKGQLQPTKVRLWENSHEFLPFRAVISTVPTGDSEQFDN